MSTKPDTFPSLCAQYVTAKVAVMAARCEVMSRPEYDVGHNGDPPCASRYSQLSWSDYCDSCKKRVDLIEDRNNLWRRVKRAVKVRTA